MPHDERRLDRTPRPGERASPPPSGPQEAPTDAGPTTLGELARVFLKLGAIGFGGPAAHIALMEDEFVRRRRWLTSAEFLDLIGATNLIPGPNSTEMAIHIGHRRAGRVGLLVSGVCFILPATAIVGVLAWAYLRYGTLPQAAALLYGVKPMMMAVVVQALWGLGRSALRSRSLALLGAAAAALNLAGMPELPLLFGSGALVALARAAGGRIAPQGSAGSLAVLPGLLGLTAAPAAFQLDTLFLVFLKVGGLLFGSGYVLLAFLRADLVDRLGWLSEGQLLDAIAVGQITPGPLFSTATFIGYVLGGASGALAATVGIFLPAFFFVAVSGPLIPRLRRSALAAAFLDGVNVASLALMAVVTWQLAGSALVDRWTLGLSVVAAVLLVRHRVNSVWLVLAGALAGIALGAPR